MTVESETSRTQEAGSPAQPENNRGLPVGDRESRNATLFHEHWWLDAVTDGRFAEVQVEDGNGVVGRLPYVVSKRFGFSQLTLPPFTHVLGPSVESGRGKYQNRIKTRAAIVRQLIGKLPRHDFFFQICDPTCDDGLALVDGLAFQECGFQVKTQYTYRIDCRNSPDVLLQHMHIKARQPIRMAQKLYDVVSVGDADVFTRFYLNALRARGLKPNIPLGRFADLYSQCRARACGEVLAAMDESGAPAAMIFVVWDRRTMYYLLSVRAPDRPDKGAVNLLIWSAMQKAHRLGLSFDLDGVSTSGNARFLSHFGGELRTRMVVTSSRPLFSTLQHFKRMLGYGSTSSYS